LFVGALSNLWRGSSELSDAAEQQLAPKADSGCNASTSGSNAKWDNQK
jgi:hypothetical protein